MDTSEVMRAICLVHDDPLLAPLDKAVATRIYLSMDTFGECRLSKRAIARIENIDRSSVQKAIARLCEAGWLVQVGAGTLGYIYRPGPRVTHQSGWQEQQGAEKNSSSGRKNQPPSGIRRMDMPRDRTERIIASLTQLQRLYDAAATSDMQAITDQERRMWLAASEKIQEDIDVLARHLSLYPPLEDDGD